VAYHQLHNKDSVPSVQKNNLVFIDTTLTQKSVLYDLRYTRYRVGFSVMNKWKYWFFGPHVLDFFVGVTIKGKSS
jgi:hypothetical protein